MCRKCSVDFLPIFRKSVLISRSLVRLTAEVGLSLKQAIYYRSALLHLFLSRFIRVFVIRAHGAPTTTKSPGRMGLGAEA